MKWSCSSLKIKVGSFHLYYSMSMLCTLQLQYVIVTVWFLLLLLLIKYTLGLFKVKLIINVDLHCIQSTHWLGLPACLRQFSPQPTECLQVTLLQQHKPCQTYPPDRHWHFHNYLHSIFTITCHGTNTITCHILQAPWGFAVIGHLVYTR